MLERLESYQQSPEHSHIDEATGIWIDEGHKNFCTYISSNNDDKSALELLKESMFRPVVLLSTQRYFSMPDEQREMLFRYYLGSKEKGSREAHARRIVIFDEKPYFITTAPITIRNFNDCDTALQDGIPRGNKYKDWVLREYRAFRNNMENILRKNEEAAPNKSPDRFYWRDRNSQNITSNDERFFELLQEYKREICKVYSNAMTDFFNFKRLMEDGSFFITQKGRNMEYKSYFELYQDNRDKFYLGQKKAKFFVLDGTSLLDPDYNIDYINLIDFPQYNIKLNMKIKQYSVNSSKSYLVNSKHKDNLIKPIKSTITNDKKDTCEMLVVTYNKIENYFKGNDIKVNHFGGIKGKNSYRTMQYMSQVGLNRYDDFEYLIRHISKNPDILNLLKQMDENSSRKYIESAMKQKHGMFEIEKLNEIMFNALLADFEQNIFRTAIRNYDNDKPVTIYTYWNCNAYSRLNDLIKERFTPLGVEIEYLGEPLAVTTSKVKDRNYV